MAKRSSRLQFSQEELAAPDVKKAVQKVEKQLDKLEKTESKISKKATRQRVADPKTGKVSTRLVFEEKKRPPSKLSHEAHAAPAEMAVGAVRRQVQQDSDDNSGVNAANALAEGTQRAFHTGSSIHHSQKLKPYRNADRAAAQVDKANVEALNQAFEHQQGFSSNPYSRWQQKRAIKKAYAEAQAGKAASGSVKASEIIKKSAEKSEKALSKIVRSPKSFLLAAVAAILLILMLGTVSSCSMMVQGTSAALGASSYPSEDSEMVDAEARYCAMERELQQYLDNYELTHDYHEYSFELDDIEHDPYVLISTVTALVGGEWTADEVEDILAMLFEKQYILTETVTSETRTKTETVIEEQPMRDPITGEIILDRYGDPIMEEVEVEEEVEYTHYICHVELENFNLSHVPVYIMSEEQLSRYAIYMSTLGNRPDLFPGSDYVDRYYGNTDAGYEIPPEVLEDEVFAAMIKEAEKYLGYPYVWGGSNPSTSFDCSGFVCWVLNNCGAGWNLGRISAQGLYNICTRVSSANVQPGDLVFFQGTYDTPGVSHVGIYVGNQTIIHCGDPIKYARIDTSYWQSHFLAYARLPRP